MWNDALDYAITTDAGLFAVLFICLLCVTGLGIRWVMKKNDEREQRYIKVIENQAESLKSIDFLQKDLREIKDYIFKGR